ncbi:MAG TPA: hypothetical protein VEQ65_05650 [Opitutus sp.]|nr:hypothetical protein [Opitutus sp.]
MSTRRRTFLVFTLAFGGATVVAGTQLSRLLAPDWPPVRHAIVNSGGQLLALAGLFALALEFERTRALTSAPSRSKSS